MSIQTALVSRLTLDIQDLRQDKEYLRADVARLQAELDRERAEKERYRRRARELEELLHRGNSAPLPGDAHPALVKPEQFSSKLAGTVRKSPSLEIIGFTELPMGLIRMDGSIAKLKIIHVKSDLK
ncbi:hypothetical protein EST38_g7100 [Candolleomyces aberdarensis]|uniref:Uncharacterized protein n=1 Tax=Candolleomyces aberdarensis TaxID=2316362 RepID=A0A4Q2DJB3_9AGAR|nr:hypothetical protein EST38_g7100 [Candolleomyces aberdarensis]